MCVSSPQQLAGQPEMMQQGPGGHQVIFAAGMPSQPVQPVQMMISGGIPGQPMVLRHQKHIPHMMQASPYIWTRPMNQEYV